jgi:hypothetical protein
VPGRAHGEQRRPRRRLLDDTRRLPPGPMTAFVDRLVEGVAGADRVLEIGVGTQGV